MLLLGETILYVAILHHKGVSYFTEVVSGHHLFATALCFYIFVSFFGGYLNSSGEAASMSLSMNSTRPVNFGRQRLFNPTGTSLAAVLIGFLLKHVPKELEISKYSVKHFIYSASTSIFLLNSPYLLKNAHLQTNKSEMSNKKITKKIFTLLRKYDVIFFLTTCLILGVLNGLDLNFVLVLMVDLRSSDLLLGITIASGSIGAVICSFFAATFARKVGGPINLMMISSLMTLPRFMIYGYAKEAYVVVIGTFISGFCYGAFVVSAMQHTESITPLELKTSMFGLVNGILLGLATMLANVCGGILYQKWGGQQMYRAAGIAAAIWSILMFVYNISCNTCKEKCVFKEGDDGE